MANTLVEQAKFTCALGSIQTVLAIPKGIPIVHAGPGCAARQFAFAGNAAGYQGEGYAGGGQISCTNSTQTEVIFGGEKKLRANVDGALKILNGDIYVIQSGCTAGIIGDDIQQVAADYRDEGYPVVAVDTAGFKGNNYLGHELVVNAIIDQYVAGKGKKKIRKGLVNVFSSVPYQDAYWRGDLEEIKRELQGIGLNANILYGPESAGISEWDDIPNAQFNLVIGPWVGVSSAKKLEQKFQTPFLHYPIFPVGLKETGRFLREIGAFAQVESQRVENFIHREERKFKEYFVSFGDLVSDLGPYLPYQLYTVADSNYGIGTSKFLIEELGFTPEKFYAIESPGSRNEAFISELLTQIDSRYEGNISFQYDNRVIQDEIRDELKKTKVRSVILGSSWDKKLATENNDSILIRLSLPITDKVIINKSYFGYRGGLTLMEDIYSSLFDEGMITNTTHADH
ncbi:MAG: hydrogenase [Butyrivibrio sp.]|jgi:nitrogenase molybdenum-iron protein beta chain|nr:hydrogenase [Butyrivibrio sp.]